MTENNRRICGYQMSKLLPFQSQCNQNYGVILSMRRKQKRSEYQIFQNRLRKGTGAGEPKYTPSKEDTNKTNNGNKKS